VKRLYRSAVDATDNLLVVTATPEIHDRIKWLRGELDRQDKRAGSAVRFYRLKHANAVEVLATIQAIEQTQSESRLDHLRGVSPLGRGGAGEGRFRGAGLAAKNSEQLVPGPNQPAMPGQPPTEASVANNPAATASNQAATNEEESGLVPGAARVTVDQSTNRADPDTRLSQRG
jgi:hypothetical protein